MLESTQSDRIAALRLLDVLWQMLRVSHDRLRMEQQYVNLLSFFALSAALPPSRDGRLLVLVAS